MKTNHQKKERMRLHCSLEEKQLILQEAAKNNMTPSQFLREKALTPPPVILSHEMQTEAYIQYNKILNIITASSAVSDSMKPILINEIISYVN